MHVHNGNVGATAKRPKRDAPAPYVGLERHRGDFLLSVRPEGSQKIVAVPNVVDQAGISCFGDPEEGGTLYADGTAEPLRTLDLTEMCGTTDNYRACGPYDMNRHFIDCIRRGVQPETSFADAAKTMELVDAIYRSQI